MAFIIERKKKRERRNIPLDMPSDLLERLDQAVAIANKGIDRSKEKIVSRAGYIKLLIAHNLSEMGL